MADDYPGLGTGKGSRRAPASSVEWGTAREGSGAHDSREASGRDLAAGGPHEADDLPGRRVIVETRVLAAARRGLP